MLKFGVDREDVTLEAPEEETEQKLLSDNAIQELQQEARIAKLQLKNTVLGRAYPIPSIATSRNGHLFVQLSGRSIPGDPEVGRAHYATSSHGGTGLAGDPSERVDKGVSAEEGGDPVSSCQTANDPKLDLDPGETLLLVITSIWLGGESQSIYFYLCSLYSFTIKILSFYLSFVFIVKLFESWWQTRWEVCYCCPSFRLEGNTCLLLQMAARSITLFRAKSDKFESIFSKNYN